MKNTDVKRNEMTSGVAAVYVNIISRSTFLLLMIAGRVKSIRLVSENILVRNISFVCVSKDKTWFLWFLNRV